MQLLGNYDSNLTAFLYQNLLAQLETDISNGEYAAGQLFDTAAAQAIQASGQNFTSITVPEAGNTAYAEDLNTPLNVLQSRYAAITSEIANLQNNVTSLLTYIAKESALIDQTIAAAQVESWASFQPILTTGFRYVWSFAAGHGSTSTIYPGGGTTYQQDPTNNVVYSSPVPVVSYVLGPALGGDGTIVEGIGPPVTSTVIPVKQVEWTFTPNSSNTQYEEVYSQDQTWAYLATLEPSPLLTFGAPNINVILPIGGSVAGLFTVSGSVSGGSLPVYVRILFYPRQNLMSVAGAAVGQTITLSSYNVTVDTIQVYSSDVLYTIDVDYSVSEEGVVTVLSGGALIGQTFTISFQEFYPAYQCSIDQTNWSPVFMLDPNRPYPDDTTDFIPITVQNGSFPLTDELGIPLGLFIQIVGIPSSEMTLEVTTPGSQVYGESAVLTVSLERAIYMNGLQLQPFVNFPVTVQNVTAVGFTSAVQTVVSGVPFVLDRTVTVKFPRQLVRSFVITLYQKNYELKEYIADPPDALRRNTLANIQSSLPFSVQRPQPSTPQFFEGALYELGVENLEALDDEPTLPGVFVSGPYLVQGTPEVIRLDAAINDPNVSIYYAYLAYNANDEEVDQLQDTPITAGTTIPYPGTVSADHVNFYIKFVLRDELAIAEKFLLQVTVV